LMFLLTPTGAVPFDGMLSSVRRLNRQGCSE
jgi:hypothetical protein